MFHIANYVQLTHRAPSSCTILCTCLHVAGLQSGWCLGIGSTNSILHHAGATGIMGDALHAADLRASTAGNRAGVPLTGSPAGKPTGREERQETVRGCCNAVQRKRVSLQIKISKSTAFIKLLFDRQMFLSSNNMMRNTMCKFSNLGHA